MQGIRISTVQVYLIAPPMMSWGLERLVYTEHPRMELLGASCDIESALAPIDKEQPDVVVVVVESEADLPQLALLQSSCSAKLLVVTGSQDVSLVDKTVLAGARGVVRTSDPPAALIKAIEKVEAGELWI